MARIRHIALTTKNPDAVAAFYKEGLGLKEIRRSPSGAVFLTDGYINLAILNWKTEKDADVGANAPGRHRNFEMKWAGPDEVVFDISHTGWQTLADGE